MTRSAVHVYMQRKIATCEALLRVSHNGIRVLDVRAGGAGSRRRMMAFPDFACACRLTDDVMAFGHMTKALATFLDILGLITRVL